VWADHTETSSREISRSKTETLQHTDSEQLKPEKQHKMHSITQRDNPAPPKPTGIDPRNLKQEDLIQIVKQNVARRAEIQVISNVSKILAEFNRQAWQM
jgi:hypothetical protein